MRDPCGQLPGTRSISKLPHTQVYSQLVRLSNIGSGPAPEPLWLVLDELSPNATLLNSDGVTSVLAPLGSPLTSVDERGQRVLGPNETRTVTLRFPNPTGAPITYNTRALAVLPAP